MSCRIKNPKTGTDSSLGEQLVEIFNIKDDIDFLSDKYKFFTDPRFLDRFGDWTKEDGEKYKDRVNKQGEPLLLEDDFGNFYVLDKDYNKLPINNRRFNGLEQLGIKELSNFKNEVTSQIASFIFDKNIKTEDFSDITSVKFNLDEEIDAFFEFALNNVPEDVRDQAAETYNFLKEYKKDWRLEIEDFFKAKSLEYSDSEEGDSIDEALQEEKANNGLGVDLKASFEKNSKDNATAKIKLLLSFLPQVDSQGNIEYGDYVVAPKLLPFSQVWYDLEKELKDVPKVILNDKVVDPLSIMKKRIKALSIRKPYLKALLNKLDVLDENTLTQFVSAFADNTIYDLDTLEIDGKPRGRRYTRINAAETNNKSNKLLNDWGINFSDKFVMNVNGKDKFNLEKFEKISNSNLKDLKNGFDIIKKLIQRNKEVPDSKKVDMSEHFLKNLTLFQDSLADFGIDATLESLDYFLSDMGQLKVFTEESYLKNMRDFINAFDFMLSAIKKKPSRVVNKGVFINPFLEESSTKQTIIVDIAKANSFFNQELSENTVLAADKILWKYALSSHINDKINIWKNDTTELSGIAEGTNSLFAKILLTKPKVMESLKIKTTSTLQEKGKAGEGTDNTTTSEVDALNRDLFEVLGHTVYGGNPSYQTPTPADKSTALKISINHFLESGFRLTDQGYKINEKILNIFINYMEDQQTEVLKAINDIKAVTSEDGKIDTTNLVQYYHANANGYVLEIRDKDNKTIFETNDKNAAQDFKEKNGGIIVFAGNVFKNILVPSFSFDVINKEHPDIPRGTFTKSTGEPVTTINKYTESQRVILKQKLSKMLENAILDTIEQAKESDIIDEYGNNLNIDVRLWNHYNKDLNALFGDYVVNSMIAQVEFTKLFSGSLARHKDVVDYFKRIPGTYISGKGLRLGMESGDHLFTIAVLNDMYVDTEYADQMADIAHYYKDINQADAQAYITPKRWKFLKQRLGQWSNQHDELFEKLISNQPLSSKEIKMISAQPIKGVYRSLINGRPVYLKYSQVVLLPGLVEGSPLAKLRDKMESEGIDEAIMNSGIKVGANIVSNLSEAIAKGEDFTLNPITLDNRFWKLQQDLPTKLFKDTLLGSQLQKNIFNNIKFGEQYGDLSGAELYKELHKTVSALSDMGRAEIISQLGIGTDNVIKDWSNFTKAIVDMLKQQGMDNNIVKAVEKELSPYVLPQARTKILNTIFSIINKKTVKLKTNGASLIQMSNFGLSFSEANKEGIYWLKEPATLAEPRIITDIDGRKIIKPGQVFVPASFISKYIPDWRSKTPEELFGENGLVDKRALEMIGYRIPNQGTSSNDVLEVVGILPEGYGDTIVTYTGITTKTGSDFDIDKMFIMAPHMKPNFKADPVKFLRKTGLTSNQARRILRKLGYYNYSNVDLKGHDPVHDLYVYIRNNDEDVTSEELKEYITQLDNWIASQPDITLKYIEYDKEAGVLGNEKKQLQNRILELYKQVLTSENTYNALMTPLDYPFMKEDIKDLQGKETLKDLQAFSPFYQIKLKYDYLAGTFGIGQVANQLVDHMRGQTAFMYLGYNLGWGNEYNKKTIFDVNSSGENVSEKGQGLKPIPIDQSISAVLNAFVDIAKDAYITRGNWNTLTTNMGIFLLRAGVHPFKVNAFLAQPIIKEIAKETYKREGKLRLPDKTSSSLIREVRTKYLHKLILSYLNETNPEANEKELIAGKYAQQEKKIYEDVINPIMSDQYQKFKFDGEIINNRIQYRNIGELRKNIKDKEFQKSRRFLVEQILALNEYERLSSISKTFRLSVSSSKFGESGAGVNPIQLMISKNNVASVLDSDVLFGFENKFVNPKIGLTTLGTYFNNTIGLVSNLIEANPKLFLTNTEFFRKMYNEIASEIHIDNEYLKDESLGKILDESTYSALLSSYEPFIPSSDIKEKRALYNDLFSKLYKDIESLKKTSDNFFIQELELKVDGKFRFIGINNGRNKPKDYNNKITEAWLDLESTNKELYDRLVKYAYFQSGFRNNINSIHRFIPHEYFIHNDLDSYINYLSKESNVLNSERIKEQIYRHNWENSKLVPVISREDIAGKKRNKAAREWYVILNSDSSKLNGINDRNIRTFPPFMTRYVTQTFTDEDTGETIQGESKQFLYKLAGYQEVDADIFQPIYVKTFKLGYKSTKGQFHEYDLSNDPNQSVFTENNVTPEEMDKIKKELESRKEKLNVYLFDEMEEEAVRFQKDYKFLPNITKFEAESRQSFDEDIKEEDDSPLNCS